MTANPSTKTYKNFINGVWTDSVTGQTYPVFNPAHTADIVGHFQSSIPQDAENAVDAAYEASKEWAKMPAPQRGAILYLYLINI